MNGFSLTGDQMISRGTAERAEPGASKFILHIKKVPFMLGVAKDCKNVFLGSGIII